MSIKRTDIPAPEIERQLALCAEIRQRYEGRTPLALVDTFGCQQNEEDSEKIRGYLSEMGFGMTQDEFKADVIVLNTCAVREHAEMRVFGNLGALTHPKKENPNQIIAVCGCMVQQEHVVNKIKKSFRHVDLVFGPDELWRFPELIYTVMTKRKRIFAPGSGDGCVAEGVPHLRTDRVRAWLSIMNGCNNFCTYCIVPYTRFRERSRQPEEIMKEARELVAQGYREITLLGQNVNSYGKDLDCGVSFAQLIRMVNSIEGDFIIRFMTSHPKDATDELFSAMKDCEKCEKHLHLPLQSGSDRILRAMNRHYDREKYLALVDKVRAAVPDMVLTTDIIVGFPDETDEDFEETMSVVERVRFDAMFTFIYSKRTGTPAAEMTDPYTREQKQAHFDRLVETQNRISEEKHREYVGKSVRVLIDGRDREDGVLTARTSGGRLVRVSGDDKRIGTFADVRITGCNTWALRGELI
ncbi:MAG: tRNA (N6-isopentenyl adenosine(37)-C2)-methylthiotransferase MiaB [Oscillospiraceae bacterium]|nr:tRNA (N6-isopentenyl adenosine(37)-C2)-methylthiotransferase MiaB [Oscillospiraceae bacterium]